MCLHRMDSFGVSPFQFPEDDSASSIRNQFPARAHGIGPLWPEWSFRRRTFLALNVTHKYQNYYIEFAAGKFKEAKSSQVVSWRRRKRPVFPFSRPFRPLAAPAFSVVWPSTRARIVAVCRGTAWIEYLTVPKSSTLSYLLEYGLAYPSKRGWRKYVY